MTDTTPPNKQPLFIAFAPGDDLAAAFAIAVEDDRATTGGATIARKNIPRVVETVERCRPDAEQRARVLIGDLTMELLCLAAANRTQRVGRRRKTARPAARSLHTTAPSAASCSSGSATWVCTAELPALCPDRSAASGSTVVSRPRRVSVESCRDGKL